MTRLDDLLAHEQDETRNSRRSTNPRVMVPVIVAVSLVLWWVLNVVRVETVYPLVLAALAAPYGLWYALASIRAPELPEALLRTRIRATTSRPADDGIRVAARRWEQRLVYAHDDGRHVSHLIRPGFADIVDERLRLSHGITRAGDPERARALIGPQLWKFLNDPVSRRVTPQEIAILVAQMEAL